LSKAPFFVLLAIARLSHNKPLLPATADVGVNGSKGHKAAILILELRISVGSLTAARRNYLGVRCVPFAASHESLFSFRLRVKHTKYQLDVVTELTAIGGCHQFVKLHAAYSYQILVVSCLEEDFILFAKAGLRIPNCL